MVKFFFVLLLLFAGVLSAQEQQEISLRKNELTNLRDEIKKLEQEIKAQNRTEKKTFESLDKMKKQAFVLTLLISNLKKEEEQKQFEINKSTSDIEQLESRIGALRESYARSITGLYKYGTPSDFDLFINSDNVNQALIRRKYLHRFSDQRRSDLQYLNEQITLLSDLKDKLQAEKKEKMMLAGEKATEEKTLQNRITENKKLISVLKKNKNDLKKEIDARKKAEVKITALVNKLIADAERKRKEEKLRLAELEKKKKSGIKGSEIISPEFDTETASLPSFTAMKGRLNWPVQGKILRGYGEEKNKQLNTVTLNYGVDIAAAKDINVKCVSDGIVSAIEWIPGYGSIVIITHSQDYRTVYGRLSDIYVTEGQKVKAGTILARIGEALEGNVLHFEIWSSRNNQNPEKWLARK